MRKIANTVCLLAIVAFLAQCREERNPYPVPYATVNITIRLDDYDSDLTIGRVKTFSHSRYPYAGYSGVVVYRLNDEEFLAYDAACPNDWFSYRVVADLSVTAAREPQYDTVGGFPYVQCINGCNVKFSLLDDGYPRGTSDYKYPLRKYQVTKTSVPRQYLVHN